MATKWDIEKLIVFYSDSDCKLLSNTYKNEDTYLTYICKCGNEDTKKFSAFKRSPYCKQCYKDNMSKKMSFSFEYVKNDFENEGCILLAEMYTNAWEHLDYICVCGNKSIIQYANFRKGVRCKGCSSKRKYNQENLIKLLADEGCEYITQSGLKIKDRVEFICHCGRQSTKLISQFIISKRCNECSQELSIEKKSGENSYMWNPNLTDKEREDNRDFPEYKQWRNSVFERDNYTCQCCSKKGSMHAHHKDGYHWCEERRTDVNNGVTLCEACHSDFHFKHGCKNNTENQFDEWIKSKILDLKVN